VPSIEFFPDAEDEYREAYEWYAERSKRAAERFESAIDRALQLIEEAPDRWPMCDERHRFVIVKKYPYHVVYRCERDRVLVVAVAHGKRKPGYWRKRD
jgi:plasmid stabilization system protein ParE